MQNRCLANFCQTPVFVIHDNRKFAKRAFYCFGNQQNNERYFRIFLLLFLTVIRDTLCLFFASWKRLNRYDGNLRRDADT